MKTVLHLERKFTSKTETFIVNQVNTIKNYNVIVATLQSTNLLPCNKKIITPENHDFLTKTGKFLSKKTVDDLKRQIDEYKIDLIHTHYLSDALVFHRLTKHFRVPKICSGYGYDVSSFPNKFFGIIKRLYKLIFKEYDFFLAMSPDMKADLLKLGCPKEKIIVHYYGTDTRLLLNNKRIYNNREKITILQVGTLENKKGQCQVIEAINKLRRSYGIQNKISYQIVGDGPNYTDLKKLIIKYNLEDIVKLNGYIKYGTDIFLQFFKEADIFIHPSIIDKLGDKEGIPGTIVEAMASGLPVISTYHAGIPYIIENEKEGLLVKEKDVDGLARAILRLVNDEKLREFLGKNAQKKAIEELDLYKGTERLEKIYEKIIGR